MINILNKYFKLNNKNTPLLQRPGGFTYRPSSMSYRTRARIFVYIIERVDLANEYVFPPRKRSITYTSI